MLPHNTEIAMRPQITVPSLHPMYKYKVILTVVTYLHDYITSGTYHVCDSVTWAHTSFNAALLP